jgi:hypothetical protein
MTPQELLQRRAYLKRQAALLLLKEANRKLDEARELEEEMKDEK